MPRFALYYIPAADDPFYRRGSAFIGYDIRAGKRLPFAETGAAACGFRQSDLAWCWFYGFHMTITDAVHYDPADLPRITAEAEALIACRDPARPLQVRRAATEPVITVHNGGTTFVQSWQAQPAFIAFHTMLLVGLHPLGKGSLYTERLAADPDLYREEGLQARVRKFFTPTGMDRYAPHITLLNPCHDKDTDGIRQRLTDHMQPPAEITIDRVALVTEDQEQTGFQLIKEWQLSRSKA